MTLPRAKRRPALRPADRLLVVLCIVALTTAIVDRLARTGPLTFRPPATVFSNGSPALRSVDPYLMFLAALRDVLPAGATVRLVAPGDPTHDSWMNFEIAIGQLPRQKVIRADAGERRGGEFIAAYQNPLEGLGRPVMRHPLGLLYWRPAP